MPCPTDNFDGDLTENTHWRNWSRLVDQLVEQLFVPATKGDLVRVVLDATTAGRSVKAVGSGLSFEAVAASPDVMIDLRNLNRELSFLTATGGALTPARRAEQLLHVEAGRSLLDINTLLDARGQALPTLGGVQVQTLAGATSTGTHGSDVDLPPVHDGIRAIHLVTEGGEEAWIESASDPLSTDDEALRAAFAAAPEAVRPCADIRIVRSDDVLLAARCGIGRFGVIYAVVLEVTDAFFRAEWTQELSWAAVRSALLTDLGAAGRGRFRTLECMLAAPPAGLGATGLHRYLDLAFSPRGGDTCWVRRHWIATGTTTAGLGGPNVLCDHGVANLLLMGAAQALDTYALLAVFPIPFYGLVKGPQIMALATGLRGLALNPSVTGGQALSAAINAVWEAQMGSELRGLMNELNTSLLRQGFGDSLAAGRRGPSWQITSGQDNAEFEEPVCFFGRSVELVFDADSRAWVDFIDLVLSNGPDFLQAGWLSVRFGRRSEALLSMHNVAGDTAVSVEVTSLQDLRDNSAWMQFLEVSGKAMGGRPHWGQENDLRQAEVERLYGTELVGRWRSSLHHIVGPRLSFRNDYTFQRGLEPVGLERRVTAARRGPGGSITHLCDDGALWSPITVADAIRDTLTGVARYFTVDVVTGTRADLIVQRTLTTEIDDTEANNLDVLPESDPSELATPPASLRERRVTHVARSGGATRWLINPAERWAIPATTAWEDIRLERATYFTEAGGSRADERHHCFVFALKRAATP